ncbi:MAG: helix-turn-helix domain-containing protein [Opitutales bacterium]
MSKRLITDWPSEDPQPRIDLLQAGYARDLRDWAFSGVFSPFWRLYRNDRQGFSIRALGRQTDLLPGAWYLIPPEVLFDGTSTGPVSHLWIHFRLWGALPSGADPCRPIPDAGDDARDHAFIAAAEAGKRANLFCQAQSLVWTVLGRAGVLERLRPGDPRLHRVLALLERNRARPPDVATLARTAALSERQFMRWFTRQVGESPGRYAEGLRLRSAARRLVESDDTLERVSEVFGYANRNAFTRAFTRRIGEPPARFRRRHRQERQWLGG